VEPGKLAAESEIQEGDVILSANLKPVKSVDEFSKIIREDAKKRGVVMLQLQRQGQTFFRSLPLTDNAK
ncbi:PDZ domain-containing protein, partial [uncultured Bilophila sp.]